MRRHLLPFLVIAVLSNSGCSRQRSSETVPGAAATSAEPRDLAREDSNKLQGAWRIELSVWNGIHDPDIAKSVKILFHGDKFIVIDKDGNRQEETIALFPDRNPKAIDRWSKGGGQAAPGIYSLEGDTFKWCSAGGGNKVRPSLFASKTGSKQSLLILRREKR